MDNNVKENNHKNNNNHHKHNNDNKKIKLLEEKINALELQVNEEKEKALRLQAEMQNIKRHKEEEISNLIKYEGTDIIISLLPIIDNFERALSLENDDNKEFLKGFRMIYNNLINILNENKVEVIDQKDVDFDPTIHQAVLTEKQDGIESNKVIDVLQKGYKYKDKLLRPAMVKVSE